MAQQDVVREISALMRMEEGAREAYDAALGKLGTNKVAPSMHRFRDDHRQNAEKLRSVVGQMGTTPIGSDSANTFYDTVIDAVRQSRSYDGVFSTLRVAEAAIQVHYDDILATSELTGDALNLVRECARDEAEHINVLEIATHGLAQV